MRRLALISALALVVHVLVVLAIPYVVMDRTIALLAAVAGVNEEVHAPRQDASSRVVVRPSPDLLYSVCVFDLSQGPLRLSGPLANTYSSLALFADNTDVFYVANDRDVRGEVDVFLVREGVSASVPAGAQVVEAPSDRGVALFRTFVSDETRLRALEQQRREARCTTS